MRDNLRVLAYFFQFFVSRDRQLFMRIMDQNGILQIQTPGARIQVITGNKLPAVIHPHSLQVIAVITVFPQADNQLSAVHEAL